MDDKPDLQIKTSAVHLRVMEIVTYAFVFTFIGLIFVPMFVAIQQGASETVAAMRQSLIDIILVIVGYIFGSSFGSKSKTAAQSTQPETPPVVLPEPAKTQVNTAQPPQP